MPVISGTGGARICQRRNDDDDWLKNIYQLKRRFKILFKWCKCMYRSFN